MKEEKGNCNVCGEETNLYCSSCKTEDCTIWFCDKHYQSVVLTGNCCSGNENLYN